MKKSKVRKPGKILCYVDLGKHSSYLVEYAYRLSRLIDAELFVLHAVADIKGAAGFYVPHINVDRLGEEVVQAARDKMYGICLQAAEDGIDAGHRIVLQGSPVEVIEKFVKDMGIDLMVLPHDSGKGTLSGFRSDYVERFLKQAVIPFLVLPIGRP